MNETVKKYKKTMGRIGTVLLVFTLVFQGSAFVVQLVSLLLSMALPKETAAVVSSLLSAAAYFASFAFSAWLYHLTEQKENRQPVRFTPRLPSNAFLIIFAGVACVLAFAMVNTFAATFMGLTEPEEIFKLPNEFSSDSSIVLQFIAIAIVPALCEELLFRGVILSNLMPYGKATAIIISSLLFGLMHANFYQFLYATVAGLIMGCAYVLTESIWCPVLIHFINNTVSVLQVAVYDRFSEEHSWIIMLLYEILLMAVGIVCAFFLLSKRSKPEKNVSFETVSFSPDMDHRETFKGLLVPTVLAFSIISVLLAFARLA